MQQLLHEQQAVARGDGFVAVEVGGGCIKAVRHGMPRGAAQEQDDVCEGDLAVAVDVAVVDDRRRGADIAVTGEGGDMTPAVVTDRAIQSRDLRTAHTVEQTSVRGGQGRRKGACVRCSACFHGIQRECGVRACGDAVIQCAGGSF